MAFSLKSLAGLIKSFLPDVGAAVRRFPLAALIAVVFTALNLFDAKQALGLDGDAWMRVSFGLGAGFLWSVSVSLYAERKEIRSRISRTGSGPNILRSRSSSSRSIQRSKSRRRTSASITNRTLPNSIGRKVCDFRRSYSRKNRQKNSGDQKPNPAQS